MKMAENQAKKEQVHTVFQNISQKYDRLNNIISFEQHKVWRKHVMSTMNVQKGSKALDVCCGTCLLYTSPSPRDLHVSRMPSSA